MTLTLFCTAILLYVVWQVYQIGYRRGFYSGEKKEFVRIAKQLLDEDDNSMKEFAELAMHKR